MITVSVPSKVHLLGEHAVVYGKPAFLGAIDKRISVTIQTSKTKQIRGDQGYIKEIKQLLEILEREIQTQTKRKVEESYSIKINSQIPVRFGLGSSAALSASLTASLLSFLNLPWSKKIVFDIAYEGEKFFHGNPSGGDLAAVIEGGFLWFRKEFEFLKTFATFAFKPHKNIKQFILINTGKPEESTRDMVEKVAKLKTNYPQKIQALFDSQEDLTKQMVIAFKEGYEEKLIDCIKFGEHNLEKLGVVGKKAITLIRSIENIGGAAKISGAGGVRKGSGMLLVYHKDTNKLLNYVRQKKLEFLKIRIGTQGLRRDE